jgi:EAL domain-containing protein (putative c-di-GMP-specific phosphodiesterase class I)
MSAHIKTRPDQMDRFVGFSFAAADMLVEIDGKHCLTFAAGNFKEKLGFSPESFIGRAVSEIIAPEDGGRLELALSLLAERGRLTPIALRLADDARTQMSLAGLSLRDARGIAWLTLARMPETSQESSTLAATPMLRQAIGHCLTSGGGDVGLIEVKDWQDLHDIDRRALESGIAGVLRDAGGRGALAAELSQGRFGVLAHAPLDMVELQNAVSKILTAAGVRKSVRISNISLDTEGSDPAQSMRAMRFALTRFGAGGAEAMKSGGFGQGLRGFLANTANKAASVRRAIEAGRFNLVFQPVADIATRKIHHFEALLRPLPMAGHETGSTQDFVSFAEATGLAELLDSAVMTRAIEILRGCAAHAAINLSGLSLQNPGFVEILQKTLAANPQLTSRLLVEITETADIDDIPHASATVDMISTYGVKICLDDFGAGSAAFRYLREFRVDFVKIDGSYVRQARCGARESGFVGAMSELARCVGAKAIAEMVETEEQAKQMVALGVQYGQGFLFGKPGRLPGAI